MLRMDGQIQKRTVFLYPKATIQSALSLIESVATAFAAHYNDLMIISLPLFNRSIQNIFIKH